MLVISVTCLVVVERRWFYYTCVRVAIKGQNLGALH